FFPELFTTESSHLRTLRVLDQVFYQKMKTVLNSEELNCIFPSLPAVIEVHASLCESMKRLRDSSFVNAIGDIMLARECEAHPQCRRLQLKDLLVSEMQRLTKYPLLLGNIIKYTDKLQALLLEDLLVLLQRVDDRLVLRCPTKTLGGGGSDLKMFFSPIVRLDSVLVRSVATGERNSGLFVSVPERVLGTPLRVSPGKGTAACWKDLLEEAVSLATQSQAPANHRPAAVTSSSLDLEPESSGTTGSVDYNSEESLVEPSVSMETETAEDTDEVTTPTPPADQSVGGIDDVTEPPPPSFAGGVADAALQDGESLT
ncbi:UNVERIFIED_CONTAM: hypothetical protein FKN15_058844, partial [Acipenser sinensis]